MYEIIIPAETAYVRWQCMRVLAVSQHLTVSGHNDETKMAHECYESSVTYHHIDIYVCYMVPR